MLVDIVISHLRIVAWLIFSALVLPRVLFRADTPDEIARVARTAVLLIVSASSLWLIGIFDIGNYIMSVVAFGVGRARIKEPNLGRNVIRWIWMTLTNIFFQPARVYADVPVTKQEGKKPKAPPKEEAPKVTRLARIAQAGTAVLGTVRRAPAAAKSIPRKVKSVPERARAFVAAVKDLPNSEFFAFPFVAAIVAGYKTFPQRAKRWLVKYAEVLLLFFWLSVFSTIALLQRLSSDSPLTPTDIENAVNAIKWNSDSGVWVFDAILLQVMASMSVQPAVVSPIILGAALVFISGWSGSAAFRRFAPGCPRFMGAFACMLQPAIAMKLGTPVSLSAFTSICLPWFVLGASDLARSSLRAPFIVAISAIFGHEIFILGVVVVIASMVADRAERIPKSFQKPWVALVLLILANGALFALHHEIRWLPSDQGPPISKVDLFVSVGAAVWLMIGNPRGRRPQVVVAGRALGIMFMVLVAAAGLVPEAGKVYWSHPVSIRTVATINIFVVVADLVMILTLHWLKVSLWAAAVSLVLWWSKPLFVKPSEPTGSKERLWLGRRIWKNTIPWRYTIVAHPSLRPYFIDRAYFLNENDLPRVFPAAEFRYDPKKPDAIFGTQDAYLIVDKGPPPASALMSDWLADIQEDETAYPRPKLRLDLSDQRYRVFQLHRDFAEEAKQTKLKKTKLEATKLKSTKLKAKSNKADD